MKDIFYKLVSTKLGLSILILFALITFINPHPISAQGMLGQFRVTPHPSQNSSTLEEEAKGKEIYDRLQSKQVQCKDLKDEDFDVLGEYFMGQRVGSAHAAMNTMMIQMMGEAGESEMHISLGKRLSGCDTGAPIPASGSGFLPMMGINGSTNQPWRGGRFSMMGGNWGLGMMGGWNSGWSILSNIICVLVVIFLVLGIIYFWKGITGKGRK